VTRFGWLFAIATLLAASPALADRPRPTYIVTEPAEGPRRGALTNVIYLNRCAGPGDCDFVASTVEDSGSNQSSILQQNGSLTPFNGGDVAWASVVECVKTAYKSFDVTITDQDPSPAPHFEAVVAGAPDELGFPDNVGGVAPFNCGIINNAITYSFANIYQGSVPDICWTVAQESAHAFGLDHEFLCEDPMTYLSTCAPDKWFRNEDGKCGEFEARQCMCGGTTQNSYTSILDVFGPSGSDTPPTVSITDPQNGASVRKGFPVSVTASDDIDVSRVELWVNNRLIEAINDEPFAFAVPPTLSDGIQLVEVRAFDTAGVQATAKIEVTQGAPCQSADQCLDVETCVDGRCVLGPGSPGGLGEACQGNGDCSGGQCGDDGEDKFCTESCHEGEGGCPDGFGCRPAGDDGVCWPGYDDAGGCQSGRGADGLAAIALGSVAIALVARRRRRRG